MLSDTHCHLNLSDYSNDLDEVISRAQENGVSRILVPGIDIESSIMAIKLSEKYPLIYAAVGVHPNEALKWESSSVNEIRSMLSHPKVVALGEIGLDFYRNYCPVPIQIAVLNKQLKLTMEANKPVIIHCRNASNQLLPIMLSWHLELINGFSPLCTRPGVFHSFEGTMEQAKQLVESNFKIGISGPVTFKNANQLHRLVRGLRPQHLLLETDSPYLSPHPHRGKRNEPSFLEFIAVKVAELQQLSIEEIYKITTTSADQLFLWSNPA